MCGVMEKYFKEEREKEREKERIIAIQNLLKEHSSKEFILRLKYTEEEITKAQESLLVAEI